MLFLIQYDRRQGRRVLMKAFPDSERARAQTARSELELDLNRKAIMDEVVLLEAANEAALRRTHRRYFENLSEIITSATSGPDRR